MFIALKIPAKVGYNIRIMMTENCSYVYVYWDLSISISLQLGSYKTMAKYFQNEHM
jgi:hypothetical protein